MVMNKMNSMKAGMVAMSSVFPFLDRPKLGSNDLDWWTPSVPNKRTAKLKRKRRIRNKMARMSRRRNRA